MAFAKKVAELAIDKYLSKNQSLVDLEDYTLNIIQTCIDVVAANENEEKWSCISDIMEYFNLTEE